MRALILQRHGGKAERALANVERFLESSRPWAVRGLRAFAQDAFERWSNSERSQEGRPEAEEGAVTLITVHSAKGLEWKVVIPLNLLGKPDGVRPPFVDRSDNRLWWKIGKVKPFGYDEACQREKAASLAERIRLLYVAATRARDLLVVPMPEWQVQANCWLKLTGLHEVEGPTIELAEAEALPSVAEPDGAQDAETFRAEAERIVEATPRIEWRRPSRHDAVDDVAVDAAIVAGLDDGLVVGDSPLTDSPEAGSESPVEIEGRGALRGLILHALMEGLITREIAEEELEEQASRLTDVLCAQAGEGVERPNPVEMAESARRAWNSPEVVEVREDLVA